MDRRRFVQAGGGLAMGAAYPPLRWGSLGANERPDYIVVGSGAGGGPLASRLAQRGHSVLLFEAGLDDLVGAPPVGDADYDVPIISAGSAPEDPREEWAFYV